MATTINLLGISALDITGISAVSTSAGVTSFTVSSATVPGGSSGDIQYNKAGVFGGSAATITASGTVAIPVGQVLEFDGSGYATAGLSWLAADTLAIGDGVQGDVSGGLGLTALILFGSSAYSYYDLFHTTIMSGATQNWNLILPETPGSPGQVLTTNGLGFTSWTTPTAPGTGTVTSFSANSLTPIFTTSVATPTTTPVLSFSLSNAAQNAFLSGPSTGGTGAPTYRAIVTADVPTLNQNTSGSAGSVPWSGITNSAGNLSLSNAAFTTTFNQTSAVAWLWANTTPTVTGAATTVALSTSTPPSNVAGNTWRYTLAAAESGAGSNAWVGASVIISGYTTTATGNNGTFVIIASTTTTFDVVNASGTTADGGTPVVISSAVVNSPILQLAGTVNTGTAGTLNSVADVWSIQVVIGSVVPNPTSTLTFTHSGSTGVAAIELPANTSKVPSLQFGTSGLLGVGQGTATGDLGLYSNNSGIIQLFQGGVEYGFIENFNAGILFEAFNATGTAAFVLGSDYSATQGIQINFGNAAAFTGPASGSLATLGITGNGSVSATWNPGTGSNGNYYGILSNPTINQSGSASGNFVALGSYPFVEAVTGTKTNNYLLGIGTASIGTINSINFPTLTHLFTVDQLGHIGNCNADVQGSVSSAPMGITATNVVVAVGAATGTFTVTSTEGFTVGDTVTLSAGGWTAGSGLASTTATVASVTSLTVMVLAYVSGGPWVAGTYAAQTGTLTQTGRTSVSVIFANAYAHTPVVVVTPTSNAGAFYLSAVSTTGFTITYANSGTQTFNYHVMGNPT